MTMRLASHPAHALRLGAVLALLGLAAFPIYWMLVAALTPSAALFSATPNLLPTPSQIGVFLDVFKRVPIALWLFNSLVVAAGTAVLTLVLAALPAYALSRFRVRGWGLLGFALFATQMLPEAMLVVPLYTVFGQLGLLNTLPCLILADTAFALPVVAWILKGAIDAIPVEIEEAARIDGCTRLDIAMRVTLPLIAPTLAAAAVIAFFQGWNEYVFAQTLIGTESLRTASVGLASFVGELSTPVHTVMAVGVIYTLPAVCFYLLAQRYVVSGMTAGGVKG